MNKENDLDLLIKQSQTIKLGGREIIVKEMSAGKTFRAVDKYQKALEKYFKEAEKNKDRKNVISQKDSLLRFQDALVDVCLYVIRAENETLFDKLKPSRLTRKWLYKNATSEQLSSFVNIVLDPFIGENAKKKLKAVEAAIKK